MSVRVIDSVDKIVQGNTSNIVFLKSTDDSMIETLQKMSGTTHRTYADGKTVQRDRSKLFNQIDSNQGITYSTKEIPVISYNDMAFISERNSIVFRAGDAPIWNRNEMILPMSWRLFSNTITHPGHDYSLQTIPTLSSAMEFDVRKNQPDFIKMLDKRMEQYCVAERAKQAYQDAYGYSDFEIAQLDPDIYADEIMAIINVYVRNQQDAANPQDAANFDHKGSNEDYIRQNGVQNTEQAAETRKAQAQMNEREKMIFANGMLSRDLLVQLAGGGVNHSLDRYIAQAYTECKAEMMRDTDFFCVKQNSLYSCDGQTLYIGTVDSSGDLAKLRAASKDPNTNVFDANDQPISEAQLQALGSFTITDGFYRFLASLDKWTFAEGKFDAAMGRILQAQ